MREVRQANELRPIIIDTGFNRYAEGSALLDLQYSEDFQAEMDANFVMTPDSGVVEVQASAECYQEARLIPHVRSC